MLRIIVAIGCLLLSTALSAQTMLDPISVDGFHLQIPAGMAGAFGGHLFGSKNSPYSSCTVDSCATDLTRDQVCQTLKNNVPPKDPAGNTCKVTNYPAAPGIPSASGAVWAGNGCGADPWSTALATGTLLAMLPGVFSGDLNRPVQNNPSIDFTAFCNNHDQGYTSSTPKGIVDNQFKNQLQNFCNTSTNAQLCQGFAATYVSAVNKYGADAYAEDQAQLACASWGYAMKANQCSS